MELGSSYECGLSPLARGTLAQFQSDTIGSRFIPAGAGNTFSIEATIDTKSVYPRWRGEHRNQAIGIADDGGLSPLARGTLLHVSLLKKPRRFIPAGAGNTP